MSEFSVNFVNDDLRRHAGFVGPCPRCSVTAVESQNVRDTGRKG